MGNSIQTKKKVQTEANSSAHSLASPRQVKTKGSWLLGRRRAKVKTGKTNPGGEWGGGALVGTLSPGGGFHTASYIGAFC